jgi:hypothetical protein
MIKVATRATVHDINIEATSKVTKGAGERRMKEGNF